MYQPRPQSFSLPGAEPLPSAVQDNIRQRWSTLRPDYQPRSRHVASDGGAIYTNRLFLESSPYLLQHAHNPVNWFPWCHEAFAEAQKRHCPVFLSIGYSTCHWCHVMEEESFEDEEIAEFLNSNFVSIKVDREERPDVDAVYMASVQALSGRGGWPLNLFLTPEQKPFFGGTYFPPRDGRRGATTGFLTLLHYVQQSFVGNRENVEEAADELSRFVQRSLQPPSPSDAPTRDTIEHVVTLSRERFDPSFGGFCGAPKFPSSFPIRLLLRHGQRSGDALALNEAVQTLEKMAAGGIYDQLAGGFHRYSTDDQWLVPHFEKMLYDNALLVFDYTEAWQLTRKPVLYDVITETLDYLRREMLAPAGGFYSATDADSLTSDGEREEGWYFTWTQDEIRSLLESTEAVVFERLYGISPQGNFEGRSVLFRATDANSVAFQLELEESQVVEIVQRARSKLLEARSSRPAPLRDEKVLCAWNALATSAFARAGFALSRSDYITVAQDAARFSKNQMYVDKTLLRTWSAETGAKIDGFLEDYAYQIQACLDLYEVTGSLEWLEWALELDEKLQQDFEDSDSGGFFASAADAEQLIAREKPAYDGATPSGNSVAALNLLRLFELTEREDFRTRAWKTFAAFSSILNNQGIALSEMLLALDYATSEVKQIACVLPHGCELSQTDLSPILRKTYVGNRVLCLLHEGSVAEHAKLVPWLRSKTCRESQPTAYVCVRGTCKSPTQDPDQLKSLLECP